MTNGPRATVVPGAASTAQILFAGQTLAVIADPGGYRAQAVVNALNALLDAGLQLYQVKAENGQLIAADRAILVFTPADAALQPNTDPQGLAASASAALRKGLWAQTVKQ